MPHLAPLYWMMSPMLILFMMMILLALMWWSINLKFPKLYMNLDNSKMNSMPMWSWKY